MYPLYPLKMKPVFKQYLWGGENLKALYGKEIPGFPTAESWEVAQHENGSSLIADGPLAGKTIGEASTLWGDALLGAAARPGAKFPLMFKILDARENLSVQVHPDDAYAKRAENNENGKSEMWYILKAAPGAELIYGVKKAASKTEFEAAIKDGTLGELLNAVPVREGDAIFIPAGTVHAVGEGLVIAELQQNSDATYRVYDYNRLGADGKPRELHIEKAIDVSDLSGARPPAREEKTEDIGGGNTRRTLARCPYFTAELITVRQAADFESGGKMTILFFPSGAGQIVWNGEATDFKSGDTFLIPALLGGFGIRGGCEMFAGYAAE